MSRSVRLPRLGRVFLDSSAFLALVNPHDRFHAQAVEAWTRLSRERWHTFTTNFVVAETHALFLIRLNHARATAFLRQIGKAGTTIVRVSVGDEQVAESIIYQYDDKNFSYTDAASFAVMERLRIGTALTFDPNFVQYGLQAVGPDKP